MNPYFAQLLPYLLLSESLRQWFVANMAGMSRAALEFFGRYFLAIAYYGLMYGRNTGCLT